MVLALISTWFYVWKNNHLQAVNFIDGDAEFYYYYLQSTFTSSSGMDYSWLQPGSINTITHHPLGVSLLLLPFYLLALLIALLFNYANNGISLPFQLSISLAGLTYALLGIYFLKKFLQQQNIPDRITALVLPLLFFGTTLFQYSIVEPAMSHVYSFCFVTAFLFFSSSYILSQNRKYFFLALITLGMVLLIRPNNILVLFALPFLFSDKKQFLNAFKHFFRTKNLLPAVLILSLFVAAQFFTWYIKENQLYSNRYAPYGFTWLHPHLKEMLFGFEAGFFVYTPLCLLFLAGLITVFEQNRYRFVALTGFVFMLFYFFSAYSAYTYFDGLGIRVLVDYYAVFAFAGAKLFEALGSGKWFYPVLLTALFFLFVNLMYSYQSSRGILLRAGMNFNKWKYIFLRSDYSYRDCLGGANEYPPYAIENPPVLLSKEMPLAAPFNYNNQEFGVVTHFDSLGIRSNRIYLTIDCARTEAIANSSMDALVCVSLENTNQKKLSSYFQFRLNETPSRDCCNEVNYHYSANLNADIYPNDKLSVYIWNRNKQAFEISKFSVKLYNYNYQINEHDHN